VCNDTNKLPYESDAATADEFSSVMADLAAVIDQHDDHCFVIGGDFNVDFNKHKLRSRLLRDICNENGSRLATLHEKYCIDFNVDHFSFIDHLIVSAAVYKIVHRYTLRQA